MPAVRQGRDRRVRSLRLLVADDDRDALTSLSNLLQDEGHQVLEVFRAAAVVDLVIRFKPDAVLLDLGMPEATGIEIARRLQGQLREECPLLIAVTGWRQDKARELGRVAGFQHYVTKPYASEELLELLDPLARLHD